MEKTWPEPPAERFTAQAEGKHPAPCARFCEANAFEIELRRLRADAKRYRWLRNYRPGLILDMLETDEIPNDGWAAELDKVIDARIKEPA